MPTLAQKLDNWQRHNKSQLLWAALLALAYSFAINVFRDYQFGIAQFLPRVLLVFFLLVYAPRQLNRRHLAVFAPLGALASFFIVAMRTVITPEGAPYPWQPWLLLPFALFAASYTLCFCGASVLLQRVNLSSALAPAPQKRLYFILLGAMLLFWLPYFLTFGPVRISADSYVVIGQGLGVNALDDSHPILYTLLLGGALRLGQALGNINVGAWLFGFAQMAALAAALAFVVYWLYRRGCPRLLCLLTFLYYACTPVFAVNGLTLWKDVPYGAALLLLMLQLHSIAKSKGEWLAPARNKAAFAAVSAAVCFFRGNGYAILLAVCVLTFFAFKQNRKIFLQVFVPILLIIALIRGPLYSALGITRLGSVEAAAMPIQQVARVASLGGRFTQQQEEVIERFVPMDVLRSNYQSYTPDTIKKHPQFDDGAFGQNLLSFLGVWLQLLPANAGEYANAWVLQTMGYWKFDFPGRTMYIEEEYNGAFGIQYKDLIRKATGFDFRQFAADRQDLITLGMLAHIALFAAAYLVATRRTRMVLCLAPALITWLGLMLGAPTYHDYRYMLVFALALPMIVFTALSGGSEDEAECAPVNAETQ